MIDFWLENNPYKLWKPELQCFGSYALDAEGNEVFPINQSCSFFCALGWLQRMKVPKFLVDNFNAWLMITYDNDPITVLNDIKKWEPRDFEFAWTKFAADVKRFENPAPRRS